MLEAFEMKMKENMARLKNDARAVEDYHLDGLKRQCVTEGISRDNLNEIKDRISPTLLGPDMPIAVYAAGLAPYPPATSGPAWSDYAHWWIARDEARRARSDAEQA